MSLTLLSYLVIHGSSLFRDQMHKDGVVASIPLRRANGSPSLDEGLHQRWSLFTALGLPALRQLVECEWPTTAPELVRIYPPCALENEVVYATILGVFLTEGDEIAGD